MQTTESRFGMMPDGTAVQRYELRTSRGVSVTAIGYGAAITSVTVPDRAGSPANIVLGYDTLEGYLKGASYLGCIVGRFANRIRDARFVLDGREYALARNEGTGHLHGGTVGFDKKIWQGKLFKRNDAAGIRWRAVSPDGDEGYPGRLTVTAEYVLTEEGELSFEYWAATNKATIVNLTNHSYWNLAGAGSGTVFSQEVAFNCPFYLPEDAAMVPTGEVLKTAATPFDFSSFKTIGRDFSSVPGGYDHCLVIGKPVGAMGKVCSARDPGTGRAMEVHTTAPGVQFYTGNFLDSRPFPKHGAFCVETQHFPGSPNIGHFPSCILRPGETYHHRTVHKFTA